MLESKYKHCISFHVGNPSPWKPNPGPSRAKYEPERKRFVEKLRREAYRVKNEEIFFSDEVALAVAYVRAQKARDAANIIGGIADALQGILYKNDSKLVEIHYSELPIGKNQKDEYRVEVAKVERG
jgi:Holliday junction resolvase RusA-like endonuclease